MTKAADLANKLANLFTKAVGPVLREMAQFTDGAILFSALNAIRIFPNAGTVTGKVTIFGLRG